MYNTAFEEESGEVLEAADKVDKEDNASCLRNGRENCIYV